MLLMDACTKPKGRDGGGDERGGGEETWPAFAPHIILPEGWEEWIWVEVGGWGEGSLEAGGGPWGAPGTASPGPVFGVSSSWLTLVTAPDREGGQTARRP